MRGRLIKREKNKKKEALDNFDKRGMYRHGKEEGEKKKQIEEYFKNVKLIYDKTQNKI